MLDTSLAGQLKSLLERLTVPIELVSSLDDGPKSAELAELLTEIAAMSDKITYARADDSDDAAARRPSFAIRRTGTDVEVRFAGIPLGHEFSSLALALLQVGGYPSKEAPELLEQVRRAVDIPVLVAGGIVDAQGVREALDAGAAAAVVGTRFLLSEECRAHPAYKRRCLQASETVLTELFGLGWPDAPHRVIPNAATRRWLGDDARGPRWIRAGNRTMSRLVNAMPAAAQDRAVRALAPSWLPYAIAQPPTDDGPAELVDGRPLYAGANVGRIDDIRGAADLVRALTP